MGSLSQNSNIANSTVITFNPQTGATYSPSAGDSNKVITLSNAAGCTVTMPNPAVVGAGFHFWLEARNNAANLVTQFAAEKFFINGAVVAGVNSFNLSPVALQTNVGWDQVVHIACDGTNWHVIQGDPLAATNLSGLSSASLSGTLAVAGNTTSTGKTAFLVTANGAVNVTGDGTVYTVVWNNKIYDLGSNFAANTFTAPIAGKYLLTAGVGITGGAVAFTQTISSIVTTARTYRQLIQGFTGGIPGIFCQSVCVIADMAANDTATVTLAVSGGTKIIGTNNFPDTFFSGQLLC